MRDIKFRAWDKESKRLFSVDMIDWDQEEILVSYPGDETVGSIIKLSQCELLQFTGLKDKNGKEIYEEDIVRDTYFTNAVDKVEWIEESACFAPFFREDTLHFCDIKTVEVIGNIYETPGLLKE